MTRLAVAAGKVLLVLVTVICLLSIGGAMLFAFPILVPLHWLAVRTSTTPVGVAGWALLAALSLFEAGWMLASMATDHAWASVVVGVALGLGAANLFVRDGATRATALRP